MIRWLVRLVILILLLVAAFLFGIFSGSQGFLGWLLGAPTVNTDVVTVLDSVQDMSQLTTTRYTFSNYVTSEREIPPILAGLYGERLVMVAVGHITAGIDLGEVTEDDIQITEDTITITLPPPELQDCFLNERASYVISRDTGLFAQPIPEMDATARQYAVRQSRNEAIENGILEDARIQAEIVVSQLIGALLGENGPSVNLLIEPVDPQADYPETCQ